MYFVFDLDGTICFQGKPISPGIVEALDYLEKMDHRIIFASARPIRDMLPVLPEKYHGYTLIGGNGSLASREKKMIHVHAFPDEQIQVILHLIREYSATYLIDGEWDYAYTGSSDHPILQNLDPWRLAKNVPAESLGNIVKVLILSSMYMDRLNAKLEKLDIVMHRHAHEGTLDLSPSNVHKGSALEKIGVAKGQFVAFGNDSNDIPLFRNARHAVRIGDHAELGEYAVEHIPLDGDVELNIQNKIKELAARYCKHK